MALLGNMSIQKKLTLLVIITTSVALVVTALQLVVKDVRDARRKALGDLSILGRILGEACMSSLEFNDQEQAQQTLAGLKATSHIVAAGVFNKNGVLFARYIAAGKPPEVLPRTPPPDGHEFENGHVVVTQSIVHDEEQLGEIYLDFDLVEIRQRVGEDCVTIVAMLIISGIVAVFLAARWQRRISQPIMNLAKVANAISEKQDFSVRATKETHDETGFLIDCFNGMLDRIQRHETALREVNEQLASSEKRALSATEAKSKFLANMSHELRTPLNAIIGYSEMVREELQEAGQTRFVPDMEKIYVAARHQLALINDILDLSKIEAGKMTLCVETFDLVSTIEEVASTVYPLLNKNGNRLERVWSGDLGTMRTDRTKIRQILLNLLSNAAKFTEHGSIRLEVQRSEGCPFYPQEPRPEGNGIHATPQAPTIACPMGGNTQPLITFRVIDTGIGMSAEQQARLFQAFTQGDASTTRKYGGTGLGLVISKKYCQLIGGDLVVSSELGKGSTFTFSIPAHLPETVSNTLIAPEPAPSVGPLAHNFTVLVIDDEASARDLLQRMLTKEGYSIKTAASGQEGLLVARQLKPGAIILDVVMAGMDGWEVLSALKADPITSDIPVIMVTVVDEKNVGFALGATDYLLKPIDWNKLIDVLRKLHLKSPEPEVLIVEDNAQTREMLARTVRKQGWRGIEAENGRVALDRLSQQTPGVILLDLMMPEMDGFTFMAELRRRPELKNIPVIVVTAKDLNAEERSSLRGQVAQILEKGGYSTRELLDEISRLLNNVRTLTTDN